MTRRKARQGRDSEATRDSKDAVFAKELTTPATWALELCGCADAAEDLLEHGLAALVAARERLEVGGGEARVVARAGGRRGQDGGAGGEARVRRGRRGDGALDGRRELRERLRELLQLLQRRGRPQPRELRELQELRWRELQPLRALRQLRELQQLVGQLCDTVASNNG